LVIDLKAKEVFMEPKSSMLKEVKVGASEVHTGAMMDPEFHGQSAIYQRNGDGSYKGGVTFRIWYWKKDEHKRKKLEQKQYEESVKLEIARIFSPGTLSRYINLKPEEMDDFIIRYMPTVKVYLANSFNLLDYINTCYTQYKKLPPGTPLNKY
jgi:hypothetical protein